jgi:hypothetical protein
MDEELERVAEEIEKYHLTNTRVLKERKNIILRKITLDNSEMSHYQKLLIDYRYIDEVDELRMGSYIRFFKLNTDTLEIERGGFLVDIQVNKQRIVLLFKNRNKFFKLRMDECILFQKNTSQEKVLIQILDHVKG